MDPRYLLKRWKGNQRYTRRLIEAMPEAHFDFRPVPEVKTFLSQCSHIVTWLRTHSRFVTEQPMDKLRFPDKAAVLAGFDDFSEQLLTFLQSTTEANLAERVKVFYGTVPKYFILETMDNHLSHHRGQLIIYLRLNAIQPPSYVGW